MGPIIDIHCHILYGVDDGVSTLEESLEILRQISAQGVRDVILTPHYRRAMFETPQTVIEEHFRILKEAAGGIEIRLHSGCEYHINSHMLQNLQEKKRWTLAGSNYVLTEFSGGDDYSYIKNNVYQLLSGGYRPVLAHIERYPALGDPDRVWDLQDMGALIQVNADAVLGDEGRKVKKFCGKLLKQELVDYVGSDCHGLEYRAHHLAECARYVEKKYGSDTAQTIFVENPLRILKQH